MGAGVQGKLFLPGAMTLIKKLVSGRSGFTSYVFDNMVASYNYSYSELRELTEDYKRGCRVKGSEKNNRTIRKGCPVAAFMV